LEVFIRESKLEDFFNDNGETIFVSTIHKAKGKEFDNVFLMLENFNPTTDEAKRQLYVAMTRAKQNLTVHLNSNFLDSLSTENLERVENIKIYLPPNELAMHLTHKSVVLDYFINKQHLISQLMSGDNLIVSGQEFLNSRGQPVLRFSMRCKSEIESMKQRNYELKSAKINFIIYWMKEGTEQEVKIILPELYFVKRQNED
jgi:ATP-dependent DNA helicase RecQ